MLPLVSIIIATYNSEKLLPKTLKAIRKQDYPYERIEIVIVDGGSTDATLEIAKKYKCNIFNNPETEPVNAKVIGIKSAKGKYVIYIDHDEVLVNEHSISNKVKAAEMHPECKVIMSSGYIQPPNYPKLNQYISDFGDPFSAFMYNFSKLHGVYEKTMKRYYKIILEEKEYFIFSAANDKKASIIEVVCLGTMIRREYFVKLPGLLESKGLFIQAFYEMLKQGDQFVICMKEDPLEHYSAETIKNYLAKLKWRVCNNIHFPEMGAAGFNGRVQYQGKVKYKKYLFILYAFSMVLPFIKGVYLTLSRKNYVYMLHAFFTLYVVIQIVIQYFLKIIKGPVQFKSYDGKKDIER